MSTNGLLKILFAEDLPSDAELAVIELKKEGLKFEHLRVDTKVEFIKALTQYRPDIIISDFMMPSFNGMEALAETKKYDQHLPFILCTGSINEEIAVDCIKKGATDYIIKEHMTRLPFAVKEALLQARITREKRDAELLLKENENKIQSLFRAAPVGIGLVANRVFLEVNDTFCSMTGYSRDELLGMDSEMIYISKSEYDRVGVVKYKLISETGMGSVETKLKSKDGTIIEILMSSTPLDKNDLSKGVTFTALDITVRNKIEESLKLSEEKFRSIAENLSDVIFITDTEGIVNYLSPSARLFGYNIEECTGKFFGEFLAPGEIEKAMPIFLNAVNSVNINSSVSLKFRRQDGTTFYAELSGSAYKVGEDNQGVLGLIRDISDKVKRENELRKLSMGLEQSPASILITDTTGIIEYVNPKLCELSGFSKEELIGQNPSLMSSGEKSKEEYNLFWKTIKSGNTWKGEFHNKKKNGELYWESASVSPIKDEKNEITHFIGIKEDITERIRAAEAMKLAKEKAEASDRLKTTFLNNISHEVRTPLNGILGFAEIMSHTTLSEDEKAESMAMLHESNDRLLNTINNYVDISLLVSGNMTLNIKYFDPARILSEVYAKFQPLCSTRSIELVKEENDNGQHVRINSDPELLLKVMTHLLNNALKFTESGSIRTGYIVKANVVEFFVKDTGRGIHNDSLELIFDQFVKADQSIAGTVEGSGLGLSIVKGILDLLGGEISVSSNPGTGTTFTFTLPYPPEIKKVQSPENDRKTVTNRSTPIILIAEDDEANFYYINALLKHEFPAIVIQAVNGIEAVQKFIENPDINLVLMDLKMPGLNGFEATKRMKSINKNIPVIAITAYAMVGDDKKALEAGCDGYITKPINKKVLIDKMAELIKS